MNRKLFSLALFSLALATGAIAQTKTESDKKEKRDETITIRKKGGSGDKTTIVIDGDKITVDGKPIEDLKNTDIEVFRSRDRMPLQLRRSAPMGGMKMLLDGVPGAGNRAFLGVSSAKDEKGAKINSIEKESAAEKAGLKKDDIITKVGDTKIEDSEDLYDAIGKYKPEEKVSITYLRDGREAQTTATLGKSTAPRMLRLDRGDFGDNFRDFNFKMPNLPEMNGMDMLMGGRPRLGVQIQDQADGKGVKVLDVDEDAAASKAGLKKDDVITAINGSAVNSVDELKSKLRDQKEGSSFTITYLRDGKSQTVNITYPKKLKMAEL
jgi:serine protease Do